MTDGDGDQEHGHDLQGENQSHPSLDGDFVDSDPAHVSLPIGSRVGSSLSARGAIFKRRDAQEPPARLDMNTRI